jgi:trans-aconitate methyltransferase
MYFLVLSYVLSCVANGFPTAEICGIEMFMEGLSFAQLRVPRAQFVKADARVCFPFNNKFEVIGAFDVLEHIRDDEVVLANIYKALEPSGLAIFTVPQHMFLWSQTDEYACYVRRYDNNGLTIKLKRTGFEILRSTSL